MLLPTQVLAAGVGAGTSGLIEIASSRSGGAVVRVFGAALTGADVVTIEYLDSSGTWLPYTVLRETNTPVVAQLSASNNALALNETGTYRAVKGITATATGVEVIA